MHKKLIIMESQPTPIHVLNKVVDINVFTNLEIGRSKEIEHEHDRSY